MTYPWWLGLDHQAKMKLKYVSVQPAAMHPPVMSTPQSMSSSEEISIRAKPSPHAHTPKNVMSMVMANHIVLALICVQQWLVKVSVVLITRRMPVNATCKSTTVRITPVSPRNTMEFVSVSYHNICFFIYLFIYSSKIEVFHLKRKGKDESIIKNPPVQVPDTKRNLSRT